MYRPVVLCLTLSACTKPEQEASAPVAPVVDQTVSELEADLHEHVAVLADDSFEGRAPGTPGGRKTVAYLIEQFKALGLQPGNGDSWTQMVPITTVDAKPGPITVSGTGIERELGFTTDVNTQTKQQIEQVVVKDSPMVFGGYGIVAPERGWNDFEGMDMTGKTVLVLVNDPGYHSQDPELFNGNTMTYYGRWVYKYEEAARQGAAALLVIHENGAAGYPWAVIGGPSPRIGLTADDKNLGRAEVEGWISMGAASELLKAAGLDYETLKAEATKPGFRAVPMGDLTFSVTMENALQSAESHNVVARIPGTIHPQEHIVHTAHWDHMGVRPDQEGDNIYNGASDNATGTAALIGLGRQYLKGPAPQRSILLLAVTAEESGLLGSQWYAENPLYPLETTVANLNMDNLYGNLDGPTTEVAVVGLGNSELDSYLADAAEAQDRMIVQEPSPEKGYYYRSDHFNFAKVVCRRCIPRVPMPAVSTAKFGFRTDWMTIPPTIITSPQTNIHPTGTCPERQRTSNCTWILVAPWPPAGTGQIGASKASSGPNATRAAPRVRNSYGILLACLLLLTGCSDSVWNNPNPAKDPDKQTYFSVITRVPPKHLDPAQSYATDESLFIMQIYEPPLGYHFLKRPYVLEPLGLEALPEKEYLDASGDIVAADHPELAFTRYTLRLRNDLRFQPHPSFALNEKGEPLYLFENAAASKQYRLVTDFPETGSRKVQAKDYAYGIKRLADPRNKSPMLGFMAKYIVGMRDFTERVSDMPRDQWLNLETVAMDGVKVLDERTLQITIYDQYPQFVYWLAMHFFAPIPVEADRFYHNPGFKDKNLTLDWWPVGSGPFMMVKNDPNSELVMERNPNYRPDFYPTEGEPGDREAGFLDDAGKPVPFIDRAHFRLEKEVLPLWTKFLQGYYDRSGEVHANTTGFFDQAFVIGEDGLELSSDMEGRNLTISADVKPGMQYLGFNMRDPVVGGYSEEQRKLRQALAIAYDLDEYLQIFFKGNGVVAQNVIPPAIPGALEGQAGMNPYIFDWVDGRPQRKSIDYAKQLLAEAGYPNGRSRETGEPLRIHFDLQSQGASSSYQNWTRRTLGRLGIQVEFRPADWNRTREKMKTGNVQIYQHGWLADYPDPENFLFLLYGPESPLTCNCDGVNNSMYENPEYDKLFRQMRTMAAGSERDKVVAEMVDMWRRDVVWLSSYHPVEYYLNNQWVYNTKRHGISKGTLKYIRLDEELRERSQQAWNQPVVWPLVAGTAALAALILPGVSAYRRRQQSRVRS